MFDVGFWEVALIGLVALLVVGPKELPGLIRGVTSFMAKARATVSEIKSEFDRELARADEIKRLVEQEAEKTELQKIAQELNKTIPIDGPPMTAAPPPRPGEADEEAHPPKDPRERTS